jgi:hypothetical protein
MKTKLLTILCATAISLSSINNGHANDCDKSCDNDKSVAVVADVAVARPGCFLATVLGATVFVVALPFAVMSRSVDKTAHTLVVCPAKATFTRPLGDFSSMGDYKQ